ncbi:glutamate ABC transporter substrate-binding protein [Actinomadura rupiterrae]|uniref:glutamate ABC transporter substrate-binding protein n=1 Tax=Actinomadura rupiterrae TaxID=559627 RepID=UPI0020A4261E|nr:glutamate ABC transporter substrate-binding protein [Actinomadura rupiterrae]MCP2337840.1 glutamate transport system substrate-binding protein [Actinomadura rupiterrae]
MPFNPRRGRRAQARAARPQAARARAAQAARARVARAAGLAVLAGAPLVLGGCALSSAEPHSILHRHSLTIGVKGDQPGLGQLVNGRYQGFDVDVATYVAKRLGVPPSRITFKTTPSSVREKVLKDGTVDMVVATYSITQARKTQITFAGPYYVAHQDTMVRSNDTAIRSVHDLAGKTICAVKGSNSWKRITDERSIPAVRVDVDKYSECMPLLTGGKLEAFSTDDLILAGFAAGHPEVHLIGAPFTDEKYGIGLRKGDLAGCEAVNRILTRMYQDGSARSYLNHWFADTGARLGDSVPQFEGCS